MCGIFGSNSREQFYTLYTLNRSRGSYSFGCYYFNNNISGSFWTNKQELALEDFPSNMNYYLGHVRAPTTETTRFISDQSHPFYEGNLCYAHNGIVSNTKELELKHNITFDVDSKWIGYMCRNITTDLALKFIKGTYAVWIFNRYTNTIELARCANPIYYSDIHNSFSSTQFDTSALLEEGILYSGDYKKINKTDKKFTYKTPYFIPG
jgi:predicted glutamine amidotransferase